jgi:adenylate cyclase
MYELVFLSGPRAGEMVPVTRSLLAGRSPDCSLEVPDPNASRKHTQILFDGTAVTVADNGSSNGTFVNDVRLSGPVLMRHGDVLRLGETKLRIQHTNRNGGAEASSIFAIQESESDLSNSIVMSMSDLARKQLGPEQLSARLAAVMRVAKALLNIDQQEVVYREILDALFDVFPQAERGFLMKGIIADHLEPKAVKQRGRPDGELLVVSKSTCRKALEGKNAFLFNAQNAGDFDQGMSIVSLRIRSAMTVPLILDDAILGILQIDTGDPAKAFTAEDLELAVTISSIAATALMNADRLDRLTREQATRNNLLRFLPGPLAEQVLSGNLDIALGGRTYHGTILFSDIIGFTRLSESMPPTEVVSMMNDYFARMVPCIEREGGSVDKFIGDAIMAFWGIPFDKGEAASAAVQAALQMQNALVGFNSLQQREGKPDLHTGIGLNSGMVVAGNIGVQQRSEYTLLGDTVNTASRIEHAAGKSQVLVSGDTLDELNGMAFGIRMPPLKAKNKAEPLTVVSIRGLQIGDETVMHLPVTSRGFPATLVRRLSDLSFVIVHPKECDLCAADLHSAVPEWFDVRLGRPRMLTVLPIQATDGDLIRSHIAIDTPDLAGLFGSELTQCPVDWDQLLR